MSQVIHQIVGRTISTRDSGDDPTTPAHVTQSDIAPRAEVLLDGEKAQLGDLKRGDEITIGNGGQDGFKFINAKRRTADNPPKPASATLPPIRREFELTGGAPEQPEGYVEEPAASTHAGTTGDPKKAPSPSKPAPVPAGTPGAHSGHGAAHDKGGAHSTHGSKK